jgi:hypothetical protein
MPQEGASTKYRSTRHDRSGPPSVCGNRRGHCTRHHCRAGHRHGPSRVRRFGEPGPERLGRRRSRRRSRTRPRADATATAEPTAAARAAAAEPTETAEPDETAEPTETADRRRTDETAEPTETAESTRRRRRRPPSPTRPPSRRRPPTRRDSGTDRDCGADPRYCRAAAGRARPPNPPRPASRRKRQNPPKPRSRPRRMNPRPRFIRSPDDHGIPATAAVGRPRRRGRLSQPLARVSLRRPLMQRPQAGRFAPSKRSTGEHRPRSGCGRGGSRRRVDAFRLLVERDRPRSSAPACDPRRPP